MQDNDCRAALLDTLGQLSRALSSRLRTLEYRSVSQAQASPFARAAYAWENSGRTEPFVTDPASFRAGIYDLSATARKLEAFIQVSKVVSIELCRSAIQALEAGQVSVPFMMLRALVERTAHVSALRASLSHVLKGMPSEWPDADLAISERITKALYGTRLDWMKLRDVDLASGDKQQFQYVKDALAMDVAALNVLGAVDKLERDVPGVRIAYDVLCDFLHPNVGDLYAATAATGSRYDSLGTRHLTRTLALGVKDLKGSPDLDAVLQKVTSILVATLATLPTTLDELESVSRAVTRAARLFAHKLRKIHRESFRNTDLCPCLSGRMVRDCR